MHDASVVPALTDESIVAPLRLALGDEGATAGSWTIRPLAHGRGRAGHAFRVAGTGRVGREEVPWSLVLKVKPVQGGEEDASGFYYWKREFLAYRTQLINDLPAGIAAPRCFGAVEHSAETTWLWLEDIREVEGFAWSVAACGRAARHFGQFNGAYLTGRPLPMQPWLTRRLVRNWLALFAGYVEQLPTAMANPTVRRFCPPAVGERLLKLWEDRGMLLDALEQLPQGFCHHDAFRRNLLAPAGERTVAVDWEFVGAGAAGEELSPLVGGSLAMFAADAGTERELDEAAFAEYVAGLRDVGWSGNPDAVRFAFAASAALRYGLIWAAWLAAKLDGGEDGWAAVERFYDRPVEEFVAHFAAVLPWFLERGDEARRLLQPALRGR